jgi:hypothetical protein
MVVFTTIIVWFCVYNSFVIQKAMINQISTLKLPCNVGGHQGHFFEGPIENRKCNKCGIQAYFYTIQEIKLHTWYTTPPDTTDDNEIVFAYWFTQIDVINKSNLKISKTERWVLKSFFEFNLLENHIRLRYSEAPSDIPICYVDISEIFYSKLDYRPQVDMLDWVKI